MRPGWGKVLSSYTNLSHDSPQGNDAKSTRKHEKIHSENERSKVSSERPPPCFANHPCGFVTICWSFNLSISCPSFQHVSESCFFQMFPGLLHCPSYSRGRWHSSPARQKWIRTQLRPPGAWHPKWRPPTFGPCERCWFGMRRDDQKMSLRFPWITDAPSSPLLWSWRCSQKKIQSASAIDSYRRAFLLLLFPGPRSNGSDHKASWSFARAFTLSSGFARVSCESFCRKSPESCKPECLGRGHETCASLRSVYFLLLHFLAAKMFLRTQKAYLGSTASPHLLLCSKNPYDKI